MRLIDLEQHCTTAGLISLLRWIVPLLTEEDTHEFNLMDPNRSMEKVMFNAITEEGAKTWLGVCEDTGLVLALGGWHQDSVWFVTTAEVDNLTIRQKAKFIRALRTNRDWVVAQNGRPVGNVIWTGAKRHREFLNALGATWHDWFHVSEVSGERFQLFTVGD